MKIAAFATKDGLQSWGVINDENQTILCAADLEEMYFTFLPETIDELIEQGNEGVLALASALEKHKEDPIAEPYELSEVVLTKPANVQRNVMCIGLNYDEHIKEFTRDKKKRKMNYLSSSQNDLTLLSDRMNTSNCIHMQQVWWIMKVNSPSSSENVALIFQNPKHGIMYSVIPS